MKKKINFIFAIILCLGMSLVLSACGPNNSNGEDGDEINFKSSTEIANAFTEGSFTVKISTTGAPVLYYTVIQNNEGVFYSSYTTPKEILDGNLLLKVQGGYSYYTIENEKRTFVVSYENENTATTYIGTLFSTYFASYTLLNIDDFSKKESTIIAGSPCTKYSYSVSAFGVSVSYDYYIDDATGICLKYVGAVLSGGESGSYSWEVTQLTIGTVSLAKYSNLPLADDDSGISIGETTTWPKAKLASLATFMEEGTVPELIGASVFNYSITHGQATLSAKDITQIEYENYVSLLKSNNFLVENSGFISYGKKLLTLGNEVYVALTYSAVTKELLFVITTHSFVEAGTYAPQNVKITYSQEFQNYTLIKIGNDFYREYSDGVEHIKNY